MPTFMCIFEITDDTKSTFILPFYTRVIVFFKILDGMACHYILTEFDQIPLDHKSCL
jgi:hypothetical protein